MAVTSLMLDESWDLQLDANGNLAVTSGKRRVVQDVATAERLFRGEAKYNIPLGIPYDWEILGQRYNPALLREYMRLAALNEPNVVDVEIVLNAFTDRHVTGEIIVMDNLPQEINLPEDYYYYVDNFYMVPDVYTEANIYKTRVRVKI